MSMLHTCPKCHRESLDSNSVRAWCLYAADCGYNAMILPIADSALVANVKRKRLEASLKSTGCCVVCWATSWEPVENEEDCTIAEHPHPEGGCFRCGYCAQEKAYKELEAEIKRLQDSVAFLERQGIVSANKRIELEAEVERLRDYLIEIGADTGP